MSTVRAKALVQAYYEEVVSTGALERLEDCVSPAYTQVGRESSHHARHAHRGVAGNPPDTQENRDDGGASDPQSLTNRFHRPVRCAARR